MQSDPMCSSAGCTQFLHPKLEHDIVQYQHYDLDHDIVDSQANEKIVSNTLGHQWTVKQNQDGEWVYGSGVKLAQGDSDPICPSSGCEWENKKKKEDYPKDYPVPNFGPDHDVLGTANSIKTAEASTGQTWTVKRNDKGEIVDMPTALIRKH